MRIKNHSLLRIYSILFTVLFFMIFVMGDKARAANTIENYENEAYLEKMTSYVDDEKRHIGEVHHVQLEIGNIAY
jgi:hypothetical protein